MAGLGYRADIDGLRAIAVLSVLIFHIDPSYLPGGFLGVDIFFVISGFLITKIIMSEMESGSFSYLMFYERRIKRILPPLFFVLFCVCVAGYFILLPYDFYKSGISILSVLLFVSNFQYSFRTNDYFSGDSQEWPLLHTWSLAVEEQYYFILPLLLFVLFKYKHQRTTLVFIIIALVSFSIAEVMSRSSATSSLSYYFIITRMGELLMGSIVASSQLQNRLRNFTSNFLAVLCALLVIGLLIFVNKQTVFPGIFAFFICLPIAIIINSKDTIINDFLANRVIVFFGLISYSLYLFHWPVLAFFRYVFNVDIEGNSLSLSQQLGAMLIILIGACSSYYLIETPLRKLKLRTSSIYIAYFAVPTIIFVVIGAVLVSTNGLPSRVNDGANEANLQYSHIDKTKCPELLNLGCVGGDSNSSNVVALFGNSHAEHYFEYLSMIGQDMGFKVKLFASGGCSFDSLSSKCQQVKKSFLENLPDISTVFISYRWDTRIANSGYISNINGLIGQLVKLDKRVVVLAQPPLLNFHPAKMFNCERLRVTCEGNLSINENYPRYNKTLESLIVKDATFFDPFEAVAIKEKFTSDGKYLYSDADHLSVLGSQYLVSQAPKEFFKTLLK